MTLTGTIALTELDEKGIRHRTTQNVERGSLRLFTRPWPDGHPPVRFFVYEVTCKEGLKLTGRKVLRDAPGLDLWNDTSTVYFEMTRGQRRQRGVLRVSLEDFMQHQLRSLDVGGTSDPAKKSWALTAFYKYFIGELAEVYVPRGDALRDALATLLTTIHV
jgi:hypothetical protein